MPVMIVHGDMDTVVPTSVGRAWVDAMKSLQMNYQYIEVPGGDLGEGFESRGGGVGHEGVEPAETVTDLGEPITVPLAAPRNVPPVIVDKLFPTAGVTMVGDCSFRGAAATACAEVGLAAIDRVETDGGTSDRIRLALEVEDEPEDAVRRGVLRPHVDDEALLAVRVGEGQVPVAAGDGVDAALGGLPGAGVRVGLVVGGAHR